MNNIIEIENNILENAKISACKIKNKETRIRTYALNIAANITAKYLNNIGLECETNISLYKTAPFAENFELADIYVKGFRLDVRISFDGKTYTIPKTHEKYGATPLAYIVIKLNENLTNAEFLGFLPTENLTYPESNSEYYSFDVTNLNSIDEIKELVENATLNIHPYSTSNHEKIKELCLAFIDNEINESEKIFFIKQVLACPVCRETFCDANDFDTIIAQIKNYQELLNDSTLSVLSGNKQEIEEPTLANLDIEENILTDDETNFEENIVEENDEASIDEIDIKESSDELLTEDVEDILSIEIEENENIEENNQIDNELVEEKNEEIKIENNNETNEEQEIIIQETSAEEVLELTITEDSLPVLNETNENNEVSNQEENTLQNTAESFDLLDLIDKTEENTQTELLEELEITDNKDQDTETSIIPEEFLELTEDTPVFEEDNSTATIKIEETILNEEKSIIPELLTENVEQTHELHDVEIEHLEMHEEHDLLIEHEEEHILEITDEISELHTEELVFEEPTKSDEILSTTNEKIELLEETEPKTENLVEETPNEEKLPKPNELKTLDELADEIVLVEDSAEESVELINEETNTEEIVEKEAQEENNESDEEITDNTDAEIQNLLDDDLKALLAEDDYSDTEITTNIEEKTQEENGENPELQNDENIDNLFENDNNQEKTQEAIELELAQEPIDEDFVRKTKRTAIIAGLLILLLGAGSSMLVFNKQKTMSNDDNIQNNEMFDFSSKAEDETNNEPAIAQDINRSIANSFSEKPTAITVTKLSWQINEKLAVEPSVKEYLQTAGKNIQMNLQNDVSNSVEVVMNNIVKISLTIAPDNTLKSLQILESSGSDKIDATITQSVKNTLKYVSVPKLNNYKSDYFLTLIINF